MRKMVDTGVRLQKSLASGDGQVFYPDGNYEDAPDGMPVETVAAGGDAAFQFGVKNPAHQPLADGLNDWLAGGLTGPNAPGARGPGMPPRRR